jgi:hypothetical protein
MGHLTPKQIEDYSQSRLAISELLDVTEHLSECETCRQHLQIRLASDQQFLTLHSDVNENPQPSLHLSPKQAGSYIDQELTNDELQSANDHLVSCELCNLTIKDLRAFRNEIAPSIDREYKPVPSAASRTSWWRRTFKTFSSWLQSPVPVLSTALAIAVVAGVGWMIWRNRSNRVPEQEIASLPSPSPEISTPQPSSSERPPQQVTAQVQLNDSGRRLTLDQVGSLTGAEDLSLTYQALIKKALTSGRIEKSAQLNGLIRPSSSLMSSDKTGAGFSIKDPVGDVLLIDRPTFRWSRLEGATGYVVEIYDNNFQSVLKSPEVTGESWTATRSLARGETYNWQVKATKDGEEITAPRPPAAQAKFRILDQTRAAQIAKARQASPPSHLVLALLYADAALFDEAEGQLRQLEKENPDSEVVHNLLRQVHTFKSRR